MIARIGLGALLILLAIQFIRPALNQSKTPQPGDMLVRFGAPPPVKEAMHAACYDCHSNTSTYPWYAKVMPVGWLIAQHISSGKKELNLSEFAQLSPKRAQHSIDEMLEVLEETNMPPKAYEALHDEARLNELQRSQITEWLIKVKKSYPPEAVP